jgi:hypothetical protein
MAVQERATQKNFDNKNWASTTSGPHINHLNRQKISMASFVCVKGE